ncbi:hypothetical protein TIFTF001_004553 [Ficus carica]|uniref:Uncharacterized protein n=1 Tax=Ficus carica TaxID=3494 RepID=A0AA87ZJL6_FICCA|nr:hypothetical protein TIFTF001_004553 [Ficus carica]
MCPTNSCALVRPGGLTRVRRWANAAYPHYLDSGGKCQEWANVRNGRRSGVICAGWQCLPMVIVQSLGHVSEEDLGRLVRLLVGGALQPRLRSSLTTLS